MKKRMVSLLLTFAMLLSMVIIPASAEGESAPLTFSTVSFTEATTTFGTEIASAATNEVFAVKIKISNPNDTDFYAKALDLWMQYDESTLEPYSYKSGRTTVGPVVQVQDDFFSVEATVQNGLAKLSGASSSGTWLEAKGGTYDSTVIAYILFKVKADAERCNLAFSVTGDNNKILGTATEAGTDQLPMPGVSFEGITTSVTIDGAAPTLKEVTLNANTVTVAGGETDAQTIQATAASLKGTDLTTSVAWSVSPADGGVSIDAAGVITVANNAKAGEYTITAAPKDDKVQGGAQSATLTVVRDRRAAQITFVADNPSGNSSSITIPGTGVEAKEWTLTAAVFDQFETGMNDLQVTFSYDNALDNVSGVTVNTNTRNTLSLTVPSAAATSIPSSQDFTITASYTDGSNINISNTFTLTIRRAESEVKSIEIKDGADTIAVPTVAEEKKETTYTATVQDQYGSSTGKQVEWGLKDAPGGIEIDQTGKVTVKPKAVNGEAFRDNKLTFYVTATCGNVTKEKAVMLTRDAYDVTYMDIAGADVLEILTDKNNTAKYTVVDGKDQYGGGMTVPADNVEWNISPANISGVSINKATGELTVTKEAKDAIQDTTGLEFTITAKYTTKVFAQKTITVKRAESVATSLTVALQDPKQSIVEVPGSDNTAGEDIYFTATVKDQYGAAMSDTGVTWTLLKDGNAVKDDNTVISIFNSNHVVVARGAKDLVLSTAPVTFTVKAELGGLSNTAEFQLKRAEPVLDSFNLYKREGTNGEFTLVSQDMIVVPSDDTTKTFRYMAKPVDQYGAEMDSVVPYALKLWRKDAAGNASLVSTLVLDANGVGTLNVGKNSPTTKTETLEIGIHHAKDSTSKEVNIFYNVTFSHKDPVNVTVADTLALTYGDERGITATVESANAKAKWTWTSSDTSVVTASGNTTAATLRALKAGTATVTVTYEDDSRYGTATVEVTVEPKPLTVGVGTAHVTKIYSGTTGATGLEGSLDIPGLVGDDRPVSWSVGAYPTKNVGSGTMEVILSLKGSAKDNYRLTSDKVTVPYTITPAYLSLGTIQAVDRGYIAGDKTVSASVAFDGLVNKETLIPGADYTVSAVMANPNAGSGKKVSVTVVLTDSAAARNYTFAGGNTASRDTTVTITKIAYTGTTTASTSAKYGNTATLDLSTLGLPEGYDFAQGTVQDENGILAGAEAAGYYVISGNTLRVPLKNDSAQVKKTATITIPVSSTNYENFDLVITVKVNDKDKNTMQVSNSMTLVYGETQEIVVTDAVGKVEIESQIGGGITVMGNTVYATNVGTTTVTVKAAGNDEYAAAEKTITITVLPKPITLKIDDKSAYVGDTLPTLSYTILPGLVGADQLTTAPVLYVDVAEGADPMKQVGTYAIKTSVTPSAGDNYSLTVAEGTLSVTNRPSAITPVGPSAGTVRVDETEGGTVRVTPANAAEGSTVTIVVTPDQGQELRSLEVLDKDGDSLELTDLGGSRFSFEMPRGKVTVKAEFGKAGLPYHDVKEGDWFYSAVEYVTKAGLMGDTGHGSFEPNTNTTRAMIWAILARLSGVDTTPVSGPWYSVAQEWAMNSGVSDGTNPNGAITREQLVTMLYRYAETHGIDVTEGGMAIREFADVESVSSFAGPAMTWAVNTGLISGIDGKLVPQGLATRSQVATVLMRFAQLAK